MSEDVDKLGMLVGDKVVLFKTNENDITSIQDTLKSVEGNEVPEDFIKALLVNKICYTAVRRFGNEVKKLAFIIIQPKSSHSISIQTLFTPYMLKGLSKKLKNNDVTYTEDIIKTITDYYIEEKNIHRVETILSVKDKNESSAYKKSGYIKEGIIRDYFFKNEKFVNGILLSYIKENK